jgi:formylglycine-generating enzyme required for sulfatase activity
MIVLATSVAGATSPEHYSQGLAQQTTDDARSGITVLRQPPQGRVRIPGGTFNMGASPMDMVRGIQLCEHEPLGQLKISINTAGNIDMGRSVHCFVQKFEAEGVAHVVTVSPFWMDRTEVRVSDFMRCVSAGACSPPGFSMSDARFSNPDFPVVLVTWDDARDYCSFSKGRLPTEAEWELAARGIEGRTFPWGNIWNPHLANHGSIALDPTDATDGFAGLAPVGSIPDGKTPLGLLDMAGNAAEWVADAVDPDISDSLPQPYDAAAATNPIATAGSRRVVRGGSYLQGADAQRSTARFLAYPSRRLPSIGFRCAASD